MQRSLFNQSISQEIITIKYTIFYVYFNENHCDVKVIRYYKITKERKKEN